MPVPLNRVAIVRLSNHKIIDKTANAKFVKCFPSYFDRKRRALGATCIMLPFQQVSFFEVAVCKIYQNNDLETSF